MQMKKILCTMVLAAFVLGSHKGYLALWKEGSNEPCQIFPVKSDSLPEEDQAALETGIPARSELELAALLEDFLS